MQTEQATNYNLIRHHVKLAFSVNDSPSHQSPMADRITDKPYTQKKERRYSVEGAENRKVRATETRPPGFSKIPESSLDSRSVRIRARIKALDPVHQHALSYFYNHNTNADKRAIKNAVWASYVPLMDRCNHATKATACCLLEELLPCYRDLMMKGKDYPGNPIGMFPHITTSMWKKTYRNHWFGLIQAMKDLDHRALDRIR